MTYRRPYPWTPMHPTVPMLGISPEEAMLTAATADTLEQQRSSGNGNGDVSGPLKLLFIVGSVVVGLAVASWAMRPARQLSSNRRRRRRRSSKRVRRNRVRRTSRRRRGRTSRSRSRRRRTSKNLSKSRRARIAKKWFVFPDRRAWPLDTPKRARAAISYLKMGRVRSASDFNKIRNKIRKLWPGVWREYGRGKVSWEKTKRAKAKRARSRRRRRKRRAA